VAARARAIALGQSDVRVCARAAVRVRFGWLRWWVRELGVRAFGVVWTGGGRWLLNGSGKELAEEGGTSRGRRVGVPKGKRLEFFLCFYRCLWGLGTGFGHSCSHANSIYARPAR
jgi:hypothetical protein